VRLWRRPCAGDTGTPLRNEDGSRPDSGWRQRPSSKLWPGTPGTSRVSKRAVRVAEPADRAAGGQRRRHLPAPSHGDCQADRPDNESRASRGANALLTVVINANTSRSEVHVGSPLPESPRAIDVTREGIGNPAGSVPEPRGFANPPHGGGAFCDLTEPTRVPSPASRGQPRRYRGDARPPRSARGSAHHSNGRPITNHAAVSCQSVVRVAAAACHRHRWLRVNCWRPRRGGRGSG
jgi:hypothetical protein